MDATDDTMRHPAATVCEIEDVEDDVRSDGEGDSGSDTASNHAETLPEWGPCGNDDSAAADGTAATSDDNNAPSGNGSDAKADSWAGREEGATDESGAESSADAAESEAEEDLTEDELKERLEQADAAKLKGNAFFKDGDWARAEEAYSEAIQTCPRKNPAGAPYYANRSACYLKMERYASCIDDASAALALQPVYPKVTLRRAIAYEKLDKYEEALADYNTILEADPHNDTAKAAAVRLPPLVEAQREKLKEEMMGNLKKLGNMFLKPFGLSTENFKLQQNAEGGYSVNFEQ